MISFALLGLSALLCQDLTAQQWEQNLVHVELFSMAVHFTQFDT